MQSDNDHELRRGLVHRVAFHGWLGRSIFAAGALGASLAVGACGSSASPTILNTEKVEQAIQHSALAQRGEHAQVSCPSGVHQTKGLVFACTAVVGHSSTQFVVTELNGSGDVRYAGR